MSTATRIVDAVLPCASKCVEDSFRRFKCSTSDTSCFCSMAAKDSGHGELVSLYLCYSGWCVGISNKLETQIEVEAACQEIGVPINIISARDAWEATFGQTTQTSTVASASAIASGLSEVQTISVMILSSTTLLGSSSQRSSSSQILPNLPTSSGQIRGVTIITGISTPGSSSSSLSAGVVAGIAVGAAMIVVLAAIGGFLLWRRRNLAKNTNTALPEGEKKAVLHQEPSELWGGGGNSHEIGGLHVGSQLKELEDEHGLKVARDREDRVELPGS